MTKKNFSDMVLYKLAGGIPDASFQIDERDIWDALEHKVNEKFKMQHFAATLAAGEMIPENTMIATYENVAVTTVGEKSQSILPVTPISLPKNMGIYLVYPTNFPEMPFIPIQRGQRFLLNADRLLNDMMGQISYEPKNNKILYNSDITLFGITTVTMELCVFEISNYTIYQDMPIPADYIGQLEDELIREFAAVLPESGLVNNYTNIGQTAPGNASNGK